MRPRRFARVNERLGAHVTRDALERLLAEGDALVGMTAFSDLELSDLATDGASFEQVVFRRCAFDGVDFSNSALTDVRFESCRFTGCKMERSWLNRCDLESCSAPGMSYRKSRLTSVSFLDSQLRYADFSESSITKMAARGTSFAESAWHDVKLKQVELDGCALTRSEVLRTPLSGIDLSTCDISGMVVSQTFRELRGCIVSPEQAMQLAGLLGVRISEDA